jgi:hypothetical protein
MVRETFLDREERLCIIFPRLARIDALFADAQHVIELKRLRAVKLASSIGHEPFRRTVMANGFS